MELAELLITLGVLFGAGLAVDQIGHRTRLPRVTLLLVCGIAAGQSGFDLLPPQIQELYEFLAVSALTMVAFLLGSSLSVQNLRSHGRAILAISVAVVLVTILFVAGGLMLMGVEPPLALILGAIASATAPAATQDVIEQFNAAGPFVDTLKGVVAIDDAWGLIAFSVVLAVAGAYNGVAHGDLMLDALWEIGGAIALGMALGFPAAYMTGRLSPGEPLQAEALTIAFLCAGLSLWLGVSFLMAGMTVGAVIVNAARHHELEFHEIRNIRYPFMILFFILAGAALELDKLLLVGAIGAAYALLRVAARILGGWIGAAIGGAPRHERPWFGLAMLPQAGVAMGMALVAGQTFPEMKSVILTLAVGSTVVFELLGPPGTAFALGRVARSERAAARDIGAS